MQRFRSSSAVIGAVTFAAFLIGTSADAGAASAQIVHAKERRGQGVVFKPRPRVATRVVDGRLIVGKHRRPLRPGQVRAIRTRGVLRIRVPRRSKRVALALRLSRSAKVGVRGEKKSESRPVGVASPVPASLPDRSEGRLYSPESPFNQRLPGDPAIAPNSTELVQGLSKAQAQKGFVLTTNEWSVPVFTADSDTPTVSIALGDPPPQWQMPVGTHAYPPGSNNSLEELPKQMLEVPIPADARPDTSADAHMTIIDRADDCEYDLYGAHRSADGWHAVWANSTRLDGSGVYPEGLGTKASGFAGLAGLIWPQELKAGHIDHALFFAYPFTKVGGPVSPATASDGRTEGPEALPEGARVQLDPGLDLESLNLTPYQRTIAEAMQEYGMILGDTGGAFGLMAVGSESFATNPYKGILPEEEYPSLSRIPVNRFRVLQMPPQSVPPLHLVSTGCGSFS